jgi:hypothetical protein
MYLRAQLHGLFVVTEGLRERLFASGRVINMAQAAHQAPGWILTIFNRQRTLAGSMRSTINDLLLVSRPSRPGGAFRRWKSTRTGCWL